MMARITLLLLLASPVKSWDTCRLFKDIYPSGKELCEKMWGDSFEYQSDEDRAYTMWFFEAMNPNNAIASVLGKDPTPDTCNLQYFHKSGGGQAPGGYSVAGAYTAPSPEGDDFTECHPWKSSSCCHQALVTTPEAINAAYGEGYLWNRCDGWVEGYSMSDACQRFFVQEACMYECSPHAGQYRRYTDEEVAAFTAFKAVDGNPGDPYGGYAASDPLYTGTFDHLGVTYNKAVFYGNGVYGPNAWQMYKMPIKASYCDSFLTACQNDYFCGSGDFWDCSADYKAARTEEALTAALVNFSVAIQAEVRNISGISATEAAAVAKDLQDAQAVLEAERLSSAQAVDDAKKKMAGWAIILIIALVIILALICVFVGYVLSMEKAGKPLFLPFTPATPDSKAGGVEVRSHA